MRKINEENERIKRAFLVYLKQAKGYDQVSVDKVADAILRFETGIGFKSFKTFRIEQAVTFKKRMAEGSNARTKKPWSKSTIDGTLRAVKAFMVWLAGQPGYKSRITYSDADYFNPSLKDARIAHAERTKRYPTMEQCLHTFRLMPADTVLQRRDRAVFAFLMLTAARDGAIASMLVKHLDLEARCVYQDGREVKTKFGKTFRTAFFPVDDVFLTCFSDWMHELKTVHLFGHNDPLFPKPKMGNIAGLGLHVVGIDRRPYAGPEGLRVAVKAAFANAGLPAFGPHSFRDTLFKFGGQFCETPEQTKAWSMNLGHEKVSTSINYYCNLSDERHIELMSAMNR